MNTAPTLFQGNRWLRRLTISIAMLSLLMGVVGFAVTCQAAFGEMPTGARLARLQASPQWRDGSFFNRQPQWIDFGKAWHEAVFGAANRFATPGEPPAVVRTPAAALLELPTSGLRLTWFGHSSVLVEVDGVRVLIDPFWGNRASPIAGVGPKRWYPPPIVLAALPPIDAVLISHDHYDHLDRSSIDGMRNWRTIFVVPLGVGAHLERWGIPATRIHEVDWWQSHQVGTLRITATPARHASGRISSRSNRTLWAGFALAGPRHRIWYSGDTGFHDQLSRIGERLGPFDVTLLDSGQYDANWPDAHLGPELAVEAHLRVRGHLMVPVHWGLLSLAPHSWTEPVERVIAAATCRQVDLLIPRPGLPVEPALAGPATRWWPEVPWRSAAEVPIGGTDRGDPTSRVATGNCTSTSSHDQ